MPNEKKQKTVTFEEYQKVVTENNDKEIKRMPYTIGLMLFWFFLIIILAVLYSFAKGTYYTSATGIKLHLLGVKIFYPYLIILTASTVLFFIRLIINSFRCPKCRKFFPRGKLELYDSFQGPSTSIDSGGDYYTRQATTFVYLTRCKYCNQLLIVTKGG